MKYILSTIIIVSLFISGCSSEQKNGGQANTIFAVSIAPYKYFVDKITGNSVSVYTLVKAGASPETYEPTPQQIVKLAKAKIYFQVGGSFEFETNWVNNVKSQFINTNFVNTSTNITFLDNDPHVWLGPRNAISIIKSIENALSLYNQEKKNYYSTNAQMLSSKIDSIYSYYKIRFDQLQNKDFVTFHSAWKYLANDFGLNEIAIENEGKELSSKELSSLIKLIKSKNIKTIFIEPQFNKELASTIAKEINANLVELNPIPTNYLENLEDVLSKIYASLNQN